MRVQSFGKEAAIRKGSWLAVAAALLAAALLELIPRFLFRTEALEEALSRALSTSTDGLYRVDIGGAQLSLLGRSLSARRVRIAADSTVVEERRRAGDPPRTLATATADLIRITGLDPFAMLRHDLAAVSVTVTEPRFEISLDRTVPLKNAGAPATMPHERLRTMRHRLRIDELVVKHGSVRYDEKAIDGARPGTIRIEGIEGVFRDLANDPKVQAERICTAELHCLLAAKGPTALSMRYDLSAPQLKLDYRGTIGSMDLSALNELLVNLMGIRVKSGVVDTTWFDFHVENEMATGQMRVLYQDLDAEIMNKVTLESDLSDMTKTFLGGIKIHGSNPHDEGQTAKTISIRRTRTPETGFVKFLWENVRAGVYETVGV